MVGRNQTIRAQVRLRQILCNLRRLNCTVHPGAGSDRRGGGFHRLRNNTAPREFEVHPAPSRQQQPYRFPRAIELL